MEWSVFLISMGMLMSFALIGIGVCIGERVDKGQLYKCDNCPVLCNGADSLSYSNMGGSNRQEHSGQDLGPNEPTPEEILNVLRVLRIGASGTEQRVIDHLMREEVKDNE